MVGQDNLKGAPMYEALVDLAGRMEKNGMAPVELNVIGGFALMLHGVRPVDGVTDIDYVGSSLSVDMNLLIEDVGLAHGMEPGWINKDGMASGMSMEDFELSTGKLHFRHALDVGGIHINILDETDLLRLKVIAVDTAMTELEATGEFARTKDFHDIGLLMEKLGMTEHDISKEYGSYMICLPDTEELIRAIGNGGSDAGIDMIEERRRKFSAARRDALGRSMFDGAGDLDSFMGSINSLLGSLKRTDGGAGKKI